MFSFSQRPHLGSALQSLAEWSKPQQRLHVLVRSEPLQACFRWPNSRHRRHLTIGICTCTQQYDQPTFIFGPVASLLAIFVGSTITPVTLPPWSVFRALTSSTHRSGWDVLMCSTNSSFVISPSSPLISTATLFFRINASNLELFVAADFIWFTIRK